MKTTGRLALETVSAEVVRVVRWARETAAPTLALLAKFMPEEDFLEFSVATRLPGRVRKFSESELMRSFASVFAKDSTVESACHAFA
ncbi:hypothetical protein D3C86_1538110 [compost metagenome]